MLRKVVRKVAWLGRTASTVFGMASVALGANRQNLVLGSLNNAATAVTKLTGDVDGAALQVVNPDAGAGDTALDLRVQSTETPMR